MNFGFVPAPFEWGTIRRLLNGAVMRGDNKWADVVAGLESGRAQLWLAVKDEPIAAMVTRMDGDTLEIWLAGGAVLSGAVPYLETALQAAREAGATDARIIGRKGWRRVLAPYGWRVEADELVKEIVS